VILGGMDWKLGAAANAIVMLAYFAIVAAILVPLIREKQIRANRLGTATAAIFLTCAVHHGSHTVHMLLPSLGVDSASGLAMRAAFDPTQVIWDIVTATVGVYYWTLRRTYGALMNGAKLFDDLRERQRQALEINDNIVQGLATAKLALELDQHAVTREALESTLASARGLITELLGDVADRQSFEAGDLRRSKAALLRKA
jgi:signal transduction histidine kinase